MPDVTLKRLTNLDCIIQAEECRRLARVAQSSKHRGILNQMAETLERIATDIETRTQRPHLRLV
jgi:hypothetical protein